MNQHFYGNIPPEVQQKYIDLLSNIPVLNYGQNINDVVKAKKPIEWIDIRERQPEVGQMVLFLIDDPKYFRNGTPMIGRYDPDMGGVILFALTFKITHWLPMDVLPPLPNTESEVKT